MKRYIPVINEEDVEAFLAIFRSISLAEVKTAKHDQLGDFEILTVRTRYPAVDPLVEGLAVPPAQIDG